MHKPPRPREQVVEFDNLLHIKRICWHVQRLMTSTSVYALAYTMQLSGLHVMSMVNDYSNTFVDTSPL